MSEVTADDKLSGRAHRLASIIAAKPPAATQGTVRAIWEPLAMTGTTTLQAGLEGGQLGNPSGVAQVDRNATIARGNSFEHDNKTAKSFLLRFFKKEESTSSMEKDNGHPGLFNPRRT